MISAVACNDTRLAKDFSENVIKGIRGRDSNFFAVDREIACFECATHRNIRDSRARIDIGYQISCTCELGSCGCGEEVKFVFAGRCLLSRRSRPVCGRIFKGGGLFEKGVIGHHGRQAGLEC